MLIVNVGFEICKIINWILHIYSDKIWIDNVLTANDQPQEGFGYNLDPTKSPTSFKLTKKICGRLDEYVQVCLSLHSTVLPPQKRLSPPKPNMEECL